MKRKVKIKKEIETVYCPKCNDTEMIRLESGQVEIFECKNCKFKIKRKKK